MSLDQECILSCSTEPLSHLKKQHFQNPLVVFTSNMFAIMGLRSLYTILSKAATDLKYLEPAVGIVLGFIGSKMIAEYFGFEIPTEVALGVVALFLSGGVALSLVEKREEEAENNVHET